MSARTQSAVRPRRNGVPASNGDDVDRPAFDNLTRIAYEKIRAAIVYGRLDLGEALSENGLAKGLNVSKAPVRGALGELRLNGLVEIVPQSGTYVFTPTAEQIEQLCDFRFLLESTALRRSMASRRDELVASLRQIVEQMDAAIAHDNIFEFKRCDTEFHQAFIKYCDNPYLVAAYANIQHIVEALRYRFMDTTVYRNKALDEHRRILALLTEGKLGKAIEILAAHIARTRQFQANVRWPEGRARRKDYNFRHYAEVFRD